MTDQKRNGRFPFSEGKATVKLCDIMDGEILLRIEWDDGTNSMMWMSEEEFNKFRYGRGGE